MDEPLNHNGREQARLAASFIQGLKPEVIVSSDLQRARETAQIVASYLDSVEIKVEPGIRERGCGKAEGLTADDILRSYGFRMEMTSTALDEVPGAEPYGHFSRRVVETFNRLYDQYGAAKVLAVCHGGVMRTFYNEQINPIPVGVVFKNCSVITTVKENGKWNIISRYNTENI